MKKTTLNAWIFSELNKTKKVKSAWDKGVKEYAIELIEEATNNNIDLLQVTKQGKLQETLLNGAGNWSQYSWNGCSLIYNKNIASRLCTPSELSRKKGGLLPPNRSEQWLDTQARALWQAYYLIKTIISNELGQLSCIAP